MEKTIKYLKTLSKVLALLTLFLVGLGSYVRATGAGLACPDWPLCFGRVIPEDFGQGVLQEWLHRKIALLVSLGTGIFVYLSFKLKSSFPRLWSLSRALVLILLSQVVLGGLTVLMKLNPFIVTTHLLFGTIFLALVVLFATEKRTASVTEVPQSFVMLLKCTTLFVLIQIILGGFVGSSGASLACADIPLCNGTLFSFEFSGAQMFHMFHRILGFVILFLSIGVVFQAKKLNLKGNGHLFGILFMLAVQIILGFLNVYLKIPSHVTVTHLVVAQMIYLGFLTYLRRFERRLYFLQ